MSRTRMQQSIESGRLGILDVSPVIDRGVFPARAIVGEVVPFAATVYGEGHDAVAASLVLRAEGITQTIRMEPGAPGTDRFAATAALTQEGPWEFRVEAWRDSWATWLHAVEAKLDAGQDAAELANDLATGLDILGRATRLVPSPSAPEVEAAARTLADTTLPLTARVAPALGDPVRSLLHDHPVRELVTASPTYRLWVDRPRAAVGAWYELFPRSTGGTDAQGRPVHGTFATTAQALDRVAAMGFDVVYFPPIHPIGEVNRKGPNNTLVAGPEDTGSPWAVGSADGGHDACHRELGTIDDFDTLVARADELGLEIALDLALQCAPDHPWVTAHPEWFTTLADGTIAYAENPPKKYQDIYPLNFDNDPEGLYAEVYRVVTFWVRHGVRIFRVDNPHTKPINFWNWLIWEVKRDHPDVVFLAEAFTRPTMMKGLGMRGFSQSYTYFTWRTEKWEIEEFGRDLVASADFMNPNLFVNTPDILHASLQYGGPAMFAIRAVLASMMAGSWGVYSGYELFEHVAVKPGSEEYLDSEKYQPRPRDWAAAATSGRSLEPLLTSLNRIRHAHPAVSASVRNLRFHHADDDRVIVFSRYDAQRQDAVLVVCTLDSHNPVNSMLRLDLPELGLGWDDRFTAYDELSGESWIWNDNPYVELSPDRPAHVISVRR